MKPRSIDGGDFLGLLGLALLSVGVHGRFGWAWTAILLGVLMLCIYVVRELGLARRP